MLVQGSDCPLCGTEKIAIVSMKPANNRAADVLESPIEGIPRTFIVTGDQLDPLVPGQPTFQTSDPAFTFPPSATNNSRTGNSPRTLLMASSR